MSTTVSVTTDDQILRSIRILNEARVLELSAISDYMGYYYILDGGRYEELSRAMKKIAIAEMKHAERIGERIYDLGGTPTAEKNQRTPLETTMSGLYLTAKDIEDVTITSYSEAIRALGANNDSVSARLMEKIIMEENEHASYFADIADAIQKYDKQFLAQQIQSSFIGE